MSQSLTIYYIRVISIHNSKKGNDMNLLKMLRNIVAAVKNPNAALIFRAVMVHEVAGQVILHATNPEYLRADQAIVTKKHKNIASEVDEETARVFILCGSRIVGEYRARTGGVEDDVLLIDSIVIPNPRYRQPITKNIMGELPLISQSKRVLNIRSENDVLDYDILLDSGATKIGSLYSFNLDMVLNQEGGV